MKDTEEEPIKDRFVEYLRRTEGVSYWTVGRHVPARNHSRNFDWLLSSPQGTLALEITTRQPEAEELGNDNKTALIWSELERLIQPSTLNGVFCVRTPSRFPMTKAKLKNILRMYGPEAAQAIRKATFTLAIGESTDICTKLFPLSIKRLQGTSGLYFTSDREGYPGSAYGTFNDILGFLDDTVKHKNDQLDTDADRRVLLISNHAHFGNSFLLEAANEFFRAAKDDMSNIDQAFIESNEGVFERVYDSRT